MPGRALEKAEQLGSLGGGNHFCEMQVDDQGKVWVMLHTGSRGFGWNIAKHYFVLGAELLGLKSRSEDQIWLDASSPVGRDYWNLHNMAANFAIVNRLLIGDAVCEALLIRYINTLDQRGETQATAGVLDGLLAALPDSAIGARAALLTDVVEYERDTIAG